MLNIDWFNPFEESPYSVGAMNLIVQNLPRSERFKIENVILLGMIPGPSEPSKHINTYLVPLVDDLLKLYCGIELPVENSKTMKVKAVLSCVVCDIPATRKVCGFLGISANKGCSKCVKHFETTTFGSKPDYSVYDQLTWMSRTCPEHYRNALLSKNALTPTERARHDEKETGVQ